LPGGEPTVIESPLIKEAEKRGRMEAQRVCLALILAARFGPVPKELSAKLRSMKSERKLKALIAQSIRCADLDTFRAAMQS
jgi:hypothetical protein